MISPQSGENSVLQLNMGEGKSSVIVPMVAAALGNGQNFIRVVVLKTLATQMFNLLVNRMGGLLSRQIFYLPFSRSIKLDQHKLELIEALYQECAETGGIMVAQPEHILSFKLMSIDKLLSSSSGAGTQLAEKLVHVQRWLDVNSRDLLDESDEVRDITMEPVAVC
jgi:hypothetical protein